MASSSGSEQIAKDGWSELEPSQLVSIALETGKEWTLGGEAEDTLGYLRFIPTPPFPAFLRAAGHRGWWVAPTA